MKTEEMLKTLHPFCSADEEWIGMARPFCQGWFTYATDGRVLVRVDGEVEGVGDPEGSPKVENITKGWRAFAGLPDEVEFPPGWDEKPVVVVGCRECSEQGGFVDCPECGGSGECERCGHECSGCDGKRVVPGSPGDDGYTVCGVCGGTGLREAMFPVVLRIAPDFHQMFDRAYLRKIAALPGVVFRGDRAEYGVPLRFKFDGGEGCLMPVRDPLMGRIIKEQWGEKP